ncbi:hypothetical protein Trisim1_010013 [Trichoderma cf. simile WF8]
MDDIDFYDLDAENQSQSLSFDLYEDLNHEATQRSGALKTYEVKEGGGAIYDNKESGHCVTAERLLWIDGWGQSNSNGDQMAPPQEMTLVVLKIVLAAQSPKKKFQYMKASLIFEDIERRGVNEPQIQAWAPFHQMEKWNKTVAHHTKSGKKEGSVQVGYSITNASGIWSSEGEVSWEQTSFDEGRSNPIISLNTGNRNGVTWVVKQNDLENAGVAQELWVAVLLSRPTSEPYLARFEIDTRVGTADDFKNKTRRFFGLDPGKTKPFKVTPWSNPVCFSEGNDIRKCIDINNLDALRCSGRESTLDMKWGPNYQVDGKAGEGLGSSWATRDIEEEKQAEESPVSSKTLAQTINSNTTPTEKSTATTAAGTMQPQTQPSLPPLAVGWCNSGSMVNVDSARLTALEERMARLEARMYEQNSKMIELQEKLLGKERGWQP